MYPPGIESKPAAGGHLREAFIVGAPRSGTTWLQAVLSTDARVVTYPETALFGALDTLERAFDTSPEALVGVQHVVTRAQFERWRAGLWELVRANVATARPQASLLVDKTPTHVHHIPLIRACSPSARFVNLVRDPRAVVRSLLETHRVYANTWAPGTVEAAVAVWQRAVDAAGREAGPDLITVRLEDLRAGAATESGRLAWGSVADHLGLEGFVLPNLDLPPAAMGHAVSLESGAWAAGRLARMRGHSPDSRDRPALSLRGFERRTVARTCGPRATALGYDLAEPGRWLRPLDGVRLRAALLVDLARRGAQRWRSDTAGTPG